MERAAKLQELYSELTEVENSLKEFVKPRSPSHPRELTQDEAEKHSSMLARRNSIVTEITELEGGQP